MQLFAMPSPISLCTVRTTYYEYVHIIILHTYTYVRLVDDDAVPIQRGRIHTNRARIKCKKEKRNFLNILQSGNYLSIVVWKLYRIFFSFYLFLSILVQEDDLHKSTLNNGSLCTRRMRIVGMFLHVSYILAIVQ